MYNKVSPDLLAALAAVVGGKQVVTGEDIGADFGHDEYSGAHNMPEAVVEAGSTEDVAAVIKLCAENNVPVTVRGAGTGQAGGSVPVEGGVVLSLKGMNQILGFNEADKTLRVQPGVLLQEVKAAAESHDLYYPPDPGEQTATIGGNAATNAAGPCAVKYGTTRDYIADAVIVLADGSVASLAGNEAVLGSEGTLGVITELSLRLIEKPAADAILLFPFMDTESCVNAAKTLIDAGFDPAVAEYMDTDLVEFSGNVTGNPVFPVEMDGERVGATLMFTVEAADDDAVMERMEAIAEMAEELECLDILVGDTLSMKRDFWDAHSAFHTSMESGAKCAAEINIELPLDAAAQMVEFAKAQGEAEGLKVMINAHLGSGGMHIHAAADCAKDEFAPKFARFADAVYAQCSAVGGCIRGEYGIGCAKRQYVAEADKAAQAEAKAKYDPAGILNPGKII